MSQGAKAAAATTASEGARRTKLEALEVLNTLSSTRVEYPFLKHRTNPPEAGRQAQIEEAAGDKKKKKSLAEVPITAWH